MIRAFVDHEHHELAGGIDRIHDVACELPALSTPAMSTRIDRVLRWVDETLQPHMAWEESSLYSTIDDRAQTRWATRLVRFDHRQIRQQADRLRAHRPGSSTVRPADTIVDVRCDLFATGGAPARQPRARGDLPPAPAGAGGRGMDVRMAGLMGATADPGQPGADGWREPRRRIGASSPTRICRTVRDLPSCWSRCGRPRRLQHFDPEAVDYWVTERGRGERRTLTHATPMPRSEDFAWGLIRLVDRLGISNEYLTFGGHLDAASVDDVVVAAFTSPAPLLRRGGHSQGGRPRGRRGRRVLRPAHGRRRLQAGLRGRHRRGRSTGPLRRVHPRRPGTSPKRRGGGSRWTTSSVECFGRTGCGCGLPTRSPGLRRAISSRRQAPSDLVPKQRVGPDGPRDRDVVPFRRSVPAIDP